MSKPTAYAAGSDYFQYNSTNMQNPPIHKNGRNF